MRSKLEKFEQETIFNWNREATTAAIFTYEKPLQRHIECKLSIRPKYDNGFGGKQYVLPKSWIRFPQQPKKYSDQSKRKLVEKAKQMRTQKQNIK